MRTGFHVGDGERRLGVIRQFDSWNILKGSVTVLPMTEGSGKDMRQARLAMIMFAVPERVHQEEVSGSRSGMFRLRMG
ncbi:MAG: hypothetical protein ACLU7D_08820 [Collinsella sp.]